MDEVVSKTGISKRIVAGDMLDYHEFDLWAGGYDNEVRISDEQNDFPFAGYRKMMSIIYNTVMRKKPAKVLDIGIGTGMLAKSLYEEGNEITGIDFSDEMLKKSKAKMPNAILIQCDFSKGLPSELNNRKYDFIISTYALHHLPDIMKLDFIRTLLRCLDEEGVIIIGDVGFPCWGDLEKSKKANPDEWDDDEYFFVFTELITRLCHHCILTYHQLSHCAGILEIRPGGGN